MRLGKSWKEEWYQKLRKYSLNNSALDKVDKPMIYVMIASEAETWESWYDNENTWTVLEYFVF